MLQLAPNQPPKINWTDLYMLAESESESFADVRILTAKSEHDRICSEHLFHASVFGTDQLTIPTPEIRECVSIDQAGELTVIINSPEITDDVTWTALDMVAAAMYQLDGQAGTVYFSEPISVFNKPKLVH